MRLLPRGLLPRLLATRPRLHAARTHDCAWLRKRKHTQRTRTSSGVVAGSAVAAIRPAAASIARRPVARRMAPALRASGALRTN